MTRQICIILVLGLLSTMYIHAQSFPWQRPLNIAWSNDGKTFNNTAIYQDSAGVPSVIRVNGDTLLCAFQWFRTPLNSITWDKVAVKFSYNLGANWSEPTPIQIAGLPIGFQRPFDPTLVKLSNDSIRMYFSSSAGTPNIGLDSTVNTYSAISHDGINYIFESNPRVDEISNRVIDPAVIQFKQNFHFIAPIGSPQQGAYHYVSPDGINFTKVSDISSDPSHNWTGNFTLIDTNEIRFYGSSNQSIWYNSSNNGGVWNGYTNTNIFGGGDPSVLKISDSMYMMIYVGPQYPTGLLSYNQNSITTLYPNPAEDVLYINVHPDMQGSNYAIYSVDGRFIHKGTLSNSIETISTFNILNGNYLFLCNNSVQLFSIHKK